MPFPFRRFVTTALVVLGVCARLIAASDPLPAEPTTGEWIEDTFTDRSLWFADSDNLDRESVAGELREYPPGRRWVRVVDGGPAWITYYIPGEILGFEVDTHHFGAAATDFRFSVGNTWDNVQRVAVDFEEITGFEARWMRLYRTATNLPAGTQFLRIEFPEGTEADAARLTDVWLRCAFAVQPPTSGSNLVSPLPLSPGGTEPTQPVAEEAIEPYVVTAIRFVPPEPPVSASFVATVENGIDQLAVDVTTPTKMARVDILGDLAPSPEPPGPTTPVRNFFSKIATFFRQGF